MSNSWQKVYIELTDFIAEHPEIEIGTSRVRLPDNIRPEFHRRFNAVRTAFIEEKFPALLSESRVLSQNYLKAEQEVSRSLQLDDISLMTRLNRFLHDPTDQLRRGLYDPLFDLLKGRIEADAFEARSSQNIVASFSLLYLLGYEKWVALSLAKLLKADKSFQVIPREFGSDEEKVIMRARSPEEPVPTPEESKRISFKHEEEATLTVPDFIVHSAKVNRYIALRSQMGEAFGRTTDPNEKREWYPFDSVAALEPGLTLIYLADKPEEVSLVADAEIICRPDLIIESRGQKNWYRKEELEKVKLHHDSLKPKLGTYVVSKEPVPEEVKAEIGEDMIFIPVGFEATNLEPVIDALKGEDAINLSE